MAVVHSRACVILELDDAPAPAWDPGPLPVEGARGFEATADRRATYFAPRAARVLHGPLESDPHAEPGYRARQHTFEVETAGADVLAAEFLTLSALLIPAASFLVLHVDLGSDPLDVLSSWIRLDPQGKLLQAATALLGSQLTLAPTTRRARTVSYVTFDGPVPPTYEFPGVTAEEGWRWVLASGHPFGEYPLDPDDPRLFAHTLRLSASWRALVLRDGVSFVGLIPDRAEPFFADAEQYVRSIYLDAFLLALVQRRVLDSLADSLASFDDRSANHDEVMELQRRLTYFRNTLWWRHVTQAGPAQDVLRAAQSQHGITDLFDDIAVDIADFASQLRTEVEVRTNTALRLLTVWGLPMGAALAGAPVAIDEPSLTALAVAILVGLAIGTILHFSIGRSIDAARPAKHPR